MASFRPFQSTPPAEARGDRNVITKRPSNTKFQSTPPAEAEGRLVRPSKRDRPYGVSIHSPRRRALLHGPEQIADLPVPVAESPGAVRIGHPERSHLVEYLAPNSVFNSLPRQRSSPHLRPDDRLVTIDRVLHQCFAWCSLRACTIHVGRVFRWHEYGDRAPAWRCSNSD